MGTWGRDSFDNDDAADWIYEFRADGLAAVKKALSTAAEQSADVVLEAPDGAIALAAAHVVASVDDGDVSGLSELALETMKQNADTIKAANLKAIARRAVGRVLAGRSELHDLWHEGELATTEAPYWLAAVGALEKRLG